MVIESKGLNESNIRANSTEKRSVAIVVPGKATGGVKQVTVKLIKGLKLEGFHVKTIVLRGNTLPLIISDLKNVKTLREYDAVIYIGSIPWPSHALIHNYTKTILFVHGFVKYEQLNTIKREKLRAKVGAVLQLGLWDFFRGTNKIDLYICHSLTSCEANKIHRNFILLPQFVFPEDVKFYSRYRREVLRLDNDKVKVVTYTSFAISPRLLTQHDVIRLMRRVSRRARNKDIELVLIDPKNEKNITKRWDNLVVRFTGFMPRNNFLRLLAEADLYLEICIDEELGLASIDSALVGTPIAKLTHSKFVERQDYEDEIIWSSSPTRLINILVDYVNNKDYWRSYYAKRLHEFLIKRRNWNYIKVPLISFIRSS